VSHGEGDDRDDDSIEEDLYPIEYYVLAAAFSCHGRELTKIRSDKIDDIELISVTFDHNHVREFCRR
jgi:hypothetical protein